MPTDAEVRENIVKFALSYVGSQSWSDAVPRGNCPANSNRCNLFVYEVLPEVVPPSWTVWRLS